MDTFDKIIYCIKKNPSTITFYEDAYLYIKGQFNRRETLRAMQQSLQLKELCVKAEKNKMILDDVKSDIHKLLFKILVLETPYSLDSYFQALEFNRPYQEQFYRPRRNQLYDIVKALEDLVIWDKTDELFLSQPPRTGKLLADSTPILTTQGWKKHGDLKVGDVIFSPDGKTTKVLAVHPKHHTTHTITMTDGSQFKCHFRHEWKVFDRVQQRIKTIETQEILKYPLEYGAKGQRGHRYRFQLLNNEVLEGTEQDLPIAPYTFGAWLGDGTNQQPKITGDKKDYAIIEAIQKDGYKLTHTYEHKTTKVMSYVFEGLRQDLRKIDLCFAHHREEKYIPYQYLIAPIKDRLELLAGLLDTDGNLRKTENRYDYSTCEKKLADDVITLIKTFGWRVCLQINEPHTSSSGIKGKKTMYKVSFNPTMHIPCRLERKQLWTFSKQRKIAIKEIKEQTLEEQEQGNCITVERDGMYLAGRSLTPTHNTTLVLFLLTWQLGINPEKANLYGSFSGGVASAFYKGVIEIITDDFTYNWAKIFPNAKFDAKSMCNSKETYLDVGRNKRYHSFTARSIDGTLNGAVDCSGILIGDDLVSGYEEAVNQIRLATVWAKVENDFTTRAKESAKILWIGTRWSINDPIGRRIKVLTEESAFKYRRYKIINKPALDKEGKSNFEYDCGVGFSTTFYEQKRASFENTGDMASWEAQFMGSPIERSGQLFSAESLMYFNGELPTNKKPYKIIAPCDVAWGGGDAVSCPVMYVYKDAIGWSDYDVYVPAVVFDYGDKDKTQERVADLCAKWGVQTLQFERNSRGDEYGQDVNEILKTKGYPINITDKPAPTTISKCDRIIQHSSDIKLHFHFLSAPYRNKDYNMFMQNLLGYSASGGNKQKDDAPDSLSQGCDMLRPSNYQEASYSIFSRPF